MHNFNSTFIITEYTFITVIRPTLQVCHIYHETKTNNNRKNDWVESKQVLKWEALSYSLSVFL